MEFDELLITTGVDALVRLVKEKQRVELEESSAVLNIPTETLEDWARVLEEEGILKIEYRLTKIYLVWVRPTEEEVAQEKKSFYEEKTGIEKELGEIRAKAGSEASQMEDLGKTFAEFYTKAYAKMDTLEKKVSSLPAAKTISEDLLAKHGTELEDIERKLGDIEASLAAMKDEIGTIGMEKGGSKRTLDRLDAMNQELLSYRKELDELRKKAGREEATTQDVQMPSVKDIRKRFELLQKDFMALRSRNAQIREDMVSLHESSEILKTVAESIMGQEDKITTLHGEMDALVKDAERLDARTKEMIGKVRQNADLVERLGSSVEVARGVLTRFPSQQKVIDELEKTRAREEELAEKAESLERIIETAGGKQVTAKQYADLIKKMDERMLDTKKELDALETALEDEKGTYLTFQKIKERVVPSLEAYQQQLSAMQQRVEKIRSDALGQMDTIKSEAVKLQQSLKSGEVQDAVKVAQEVHEKKQMLEQVRASLEELVGMSENLNKRVTLLSREATLLEIRTGAGAGGEEGAGRAGGGGGISEEGRAREMRTKIDLSAEEELEFRRKREELKKLIQRLWE